MLDDVYKSFVDTDGNFLEQFQTSAFDSRFLELYLHAYFSRSGFAVDRNIAGRTFWNSHDITVAVEATTVHASAGGAMATGNKKIRDLPRRKEANTPEMNYRSNLGVRSH